MRAGRVRLCWGLLPSAIVSTIGLTAATAFGATIMVDSHGAASPNQCNGSGPLWPTIQHAAAPGIYSDVPLSNAVLTLNTFDNNDNEQINITPITGNDSGLTISHNTFVNGDNSDIAFCPGCGKAVNNSTISNNRITDQHLNT